MKGKPDNLKPARTVDEARTLGKNGGIKSGEARRRKRDMKKVLESVMEMRISASEEKIIEMMDQMGIEAEDRTRMMAIMVSMFNEAVYNGNVKAAEFIRDTIGAGAAAEDRKKKMALERERFELEKKRSVLSGEGMPVIINVRPDKPPQPAQEEAKNGAGD